MAQDFKNFLQVMGQAILAACESLPTDDTQNDDVQMVQEQPPIPNMFGYEFEEIDQKVERKPDENNPDEYDQNQQGENSFDDDNKQQTEPKDPSELDPNEDPDRQGNVRYVKDAHLVSRRENDEGTFDELWILNTGDSKSRRSEFIIQDILKGTDIPATEISSDDGSQDYETWSVGNVQMIKVRGLPE